MKLKKKKQKQRNQSKRFKIVVPYATETTTQSYKQIVWSN